MALKVKTTTNEMKSISENIKPEIIFKKKKKNTCLLLFAKIAAVKRYDNLDI